MLRRGHRLSLVACLLVGLALSLTQRADAGEFTVLWAANQPRADWGSSLGATLSFGLAPVVDLEMEGVRGSSSAGDTRMSYFTGAAALRLPIRGLTPFAGVGAGVFHQSRDEDWQVGALWATFAGLKVRLAGLITLRGEYRRLNLTNTPFVDLQSRVSVAAGIAF